MRGFIVTIGCILLILKVLGVINLSWIIIATLICAPIVVTLVGSIIVLIWAILIKK